jgi:hypothetical protein
VIRNVVIHVSNEQPLLADLYGVPSAADVGIVCTNVRMIDGKRPIFIDRSDSTFFFPNLHLRFLEIPASEIQRHLAQGGSSAGFAAAEHVAGDADQRLAVVLGEMPDEPGDGDGDGAAPRDEEEELALDEDFLQRIRDI